MPSVSGDGHEQHEREHGSASGAGVKRSYPCVSSDVWAMGVRRSRLWLIVLPWWLASTRA